MYTIDGDEMNKRGFTLIELVVSIVLVSIILVALIGSLLQLRNAYTVVHENSDVIVYTSSISRVINSDINDNNGIKFVSCETDGRKCSLILGNDERRELVITDNDKILDDTDLGIEHSNNKTTLKYLDTTKYDKTNNEEDKKLLYIRTLEIDKYQNETSGVTTTEGYGFYDMSATQYEYFENASENNIEAFTTITIRLLDGINMDVSKYDITLYGAGRYDYSNYVGRVYSIDLDNSEAETAGTTSIDEVFGVGYFVAESPHRKRDQITSIEIPTKSGKAFLGYYYKPYGVNVETKVIDSGGNIVSSSRQFKNDVKLNEETTGHVYAKWGDCELGFKIEDGKCVQEEYTVTLNKDQSGKTCDTTKGTANYRIKYQNMTPDVEIPQCAGYTFEGYLSTTNKPYHNRNGEGIEYYDIAGNSTFKASWSACEIGQYSLTSERTCTDCIKGSYSGASASGRCTACQNGVTTNGNKQGSCNANCPNNNIHVATWKTAVWNEDNTVTNECAIATCMTGYDGELSSNKCTVNTYKIAFDLNGGRLDGVTSPTTRRVDYDTVETINNPTKAGYEFTGWTFDGNVGTAMHGSTTWASQSEKTKATTFKNLTSTDEATVTLTANWSRCQAGTYNSGSGTTCIPCAKGSYTNAAGKTSCTACQATGQAGTSGTTTDTGQSSCNQSCNKAHVSTWETSTWNNNTVNNSCIIKSCLTGYTLGSNACTANTYSISYAGMNNADYGTNHPTTATYDSQFTVNNPTKAGHTFTGWDISGMDNVTHTYGSSTTTNLTISKTKETTFKNLRSTSGTVTFTATWSINQYTLTVKPNGGKWNDSTSNQTFTQDYASTKAIAAPTVGPTYTISYDMGTTGITKPTSPASVQRPFTSWTKDGDGTLSGTTYTFGAGDGTLTANYSSTSNEFTLPALSKDGHTCQWAKGKASGTKHDGGSSTTITANTTFYAICTINQYTLTVKPNGGTWGGKTTSQDFPQNFATTKTIDNPTAGPTYTIGYDMGTTEITKPTSPTSVQRPFTGWTNTGSGSLSGKTYTYGAEDGTLTANYGSTSNSFTLPALSKKR